MISINYDYSERVHIAYPLHRLTIRAKPIEKCTYKLVSAVQRNSFLVVHNRMCK